MIASLRGRLAIYLLISQVLICLVTFVGLPVLGVYDLLGVAPFIGYDKESDAWQTVSSHIVESLRMSSDGVLTLQPTPALAARAARQSHLKFGAFDATSKMAVSGSAPELTAALGNLDRAFPGAERLSAGVSESITGLAPMNVALVQIPLGKFYISASGYDFEWPDYFEISRWPWKPAIGWFLPVLLVSSIMVWFVLWREMQSLSSIITQANRIDFESLSGRLHIPDIPSELRPVVASINSALARFDDGAAQQRRFIANAAHELRTPVTILRSRVDETDESSTKPLLQRDVRHVQDILDQLLSTARAAEKPAILNAEIDLDEAVSSIAMEFFPLAHSSHREIEFVAANRAVVAHGDRRALASVIGNLIANALSAEPEGGSVIVTVAEDGVVSVLDHGPGVPETDRKLIFEPFWRKSETLPGTGLGLAIAHELVTKMGGRIWVEETPGGGATFKLSLQLAKCKDGHVSE